MSFKAIKFYSLLVLTALLTACGGGGGGGNDSGFNPPGSQMTATAQQTSVQVGGAADVVVRFTSASGAPVNDGVAITATVSPSSVGSILVVGPGGVVQQSATGTTTGGQVVFRFIGQQQGTATVTFSAQDPNATGRTVTSNVTFNVTAGQPMTITTTQSSVPTFGTSDITVRLVDGTGAAVPDGTVINASVSPSSVGNVFGVNAAGNATDQSTATTQGGVANFRFVGQNPGTATITFSAQDPNVPTSTISATTTITVTGGPTRLTIEATTDTLPINAFNVGPFVGSPYLAELTITVRDAAGNLVNQEDGVAVSVNPVGDTGGFSTLDDGTTEDVNEFLVRLGQGPVDVVAGRATVFLHSLSFAGTTTVTVTHQGEDGQRFQATRVFTIVSTLPSLPAEVQVSAPVRPIYIVSSGGNSSGQLEVNVVDGIGDPVPDPAAGGNAFNNVRIEIVGDNLGARLRGVNAAGQAVSGDTIDVRTFNGISGFSVSGATRAGQLLVRVTADQADNNVDNGIQDPVSGQRSVVISDGVLFDLQITQPIINALFVNPFDPTVEPQADGEPVIPVQPDGTYSLTVSVIASDRLGNPVLPGTVINFGLIDEPQNSGIGDFLHRGNDGRPEVGGFNFSALSGNFLSAGLGVGPGDTLVVFGKRESRLPFGLSPPPEGYRDLESARQIDQVNSETSLDVTRRFNLNDDAGQSQPVPAPGLLPYVIGRAADGNITATATTNELGVATTQMNYPVSRLGKIVVIWAQGLGDAVGGVPETVTDAQTTAFSGLAPATLTASPSQIPANTTADVTVCVSDALRVPVANVSIGSGFADLDGAGSVEFLGTGLVANLTNASGCVVARVTTSGVQDGEPSVVFTGAGASATVDIVRGALVLQAVPSTLFDSGIITLTLRNGQGVPQANYQMVGTCTADAPTTLSITSGPGVTNANGQTTVTVIATNLNRAGEAGSGECEFQTADGSASTTVTFQGVDVCTTNLSPPAPGCADDDDAEGTVTLTLTGASAITAVSSPAGITCSRAAGAVANTVCSGTFPAGEAVTFTVDTGTPAIEISATGACQEITANTTVRTAPVQDGAATACTIATTP